MQDESDKLRSELSEAILQIEELQSELSGAILQIEKLQSERKAVRFAITVGLIGGFFLTMMSIMNNNYWEGLFAALLVSIGCFGWRRTEQLKSPGVVSTKDSNSGQ